jgi:hypothetical protein
VSDTVKIVARLSQGNPGALNVLISIAQVDPMLLNPLGLALELTGSKSWGLWFVFKDICGNDLTKTIKYLHDWYTTSVEPLHEYCMKGAR